MKKKLRPLHRFTVDTRQTKRKIDAKQWKTFKEQKNKARHGGYSKHTNVPGITTTEKYNEYFKNFVIQMNDETFN